MDNNKILNGEGEIYTSTEIDNGFRSIFLEPIPKVNQRAINEIMNADLIIIGPGGLYSSLIPILLVEGISKALRETNAEKVFVVNLMNKKGQTTGFKVSDYLKEIRRFTGKDIFNSVIVNNGLPVKELVEIYAREGNLVEIDLENDERIIAFDLLSKEKYEYSKTDVLAKHRALIRHDRKKLAQVLMGIINEI